jgi:hypothetical protein
MKNIYRIDLINLGFEENLVTVEDSGCDNEYYYYTYVVGDDCLLISDASDENDGCYTIEFFNLDGQILVQDLEDLRDLIRIIKKNKSAK